MEFVRVATLDRYCDNSYRHIVIKMIYTINKLQLINNFIIIATNSSFLTLQNIIYYTVLSIFIAMIDGPMLTNLH